MTVTDRINIDPKVMLGKPVIRGTRIIVELPPAQTCRGRDRGRPSRRVSEADPRRHSRGDRIRRGHPGSRRDDHRNAEDVAALAYATREDAVDDLLRREIFVEGSAECQEGCLGLRFEPGDGLMLAPEKSEYFICRAVSTPDPDHFRWLA